MYSIENILTSYTTLLTNENKSVENNLAFANTFRYLYFASGEPVMQITGFAV